MNYQLPISAVMTEQVITIRETDTVDQAKEMFKGYHFHHLPVLDPAGNLSGVISALDLNKAINNGDTRIEEIMTPDPTILESDDTIGLAADIFLANAFHAIPIVDGKILVGILTTHDLLEYAFKTQF